MTRLPRVTGKDTLKALQRAGFAVIRTHGSHHYLYHREKDILVTVPVHAGRTIAPKTLQSILKQAGLTAEQLAEQLWPAFPLLPREPPSAVQFPFLRLGWDFSESASIGVHLRFLLSAGT